MLPANCPNCWCGCLENSLQFQRLSKLRDVWHHLSSTHYRSSCWFHQWGCYGRWSLLYMLLLMVSEHVSLSVVQDVPQSTPGAMAHWAIAPLWDHKRYWVQTSNPVVCRWNSCWPFAIELDFRGLLMACQVGSAVVLRKQKRKKLNLFSIGNFPSFWVHFLFAIIVLLLIFCCTDKYIVGSVFKMMIFHWLLECL
jgi:hypothetical protein